MMSSWLSTDCWVSNAHCWHNDALLIHCWRWCFPAIYTDSCVVGKRATALWSLMQPVQQTATDSCVVEKRATASWSLTQPVQQTATDSCVVGGRVTASWSLMQPVQLTVKHSGVDYWWRVLEAGLDCDEMQIGTRVWVQRAWVYNGMCRTRHITDKAWVVTDRGGYSQWLS